MAIPQSMEDRDGVIWYDKQMVAWREAKTHVLTHTLHYGLGVFEGVRAYETNKGTAIFRLNDHTDRLFNSAHILGMKIPYTKEELNSAQKKAVKEQLEQAKRNFIVGTATITDQREAQAKYDLVYANEINITNEIENSIDSLELIAGNNLENDFPSLVLPVKLLNPSPNNVDDWVNLSKSNNYDIKISNINTLIEEKKLLSAQSEMDSNLSAFSSATYSDGSNFGAYESTTVIAGLRFNLPLYKGAKVLSNTAVKNSKLKQSIEALKNSEKQVSYDVKKSFSKLKSSLAMVEALKQANLSTKLQLEASKLGLEVGVRTAIDVLNSEQQMSDVNNQLFSAVVDSIISHAQLKYYAGVLTLSDLKKINGLLQ